MAPVEAPLATPLDTATPLSRITTIKEDINKRIGNPVNLVDVDNTVGRTYMSALLEAMKAVAANTGVAEAMARLEAAYASACSLLDQVGMNTTVASAPLTPAMTAPVIPPATPSMPVAETAPPMAVARPPLPVMPALAAEPTAPIAPAVPQAATMTAAEQVPINSSLRQNPVVMPTTAATTQEVSAVSESVPINRGPGYTLGNATAPSVSPKIIVSPPVSPQTPRIQVQGAPFTVSSVAAAEPLKDISILPTAASINTAAEGVDPLFTKEIDDGLDQLLAEWPLFNRSGFLGRGPKQRQHPLYLKVSNLPVTLILSGRFEGATNEVMQDISDKMNGWRYQQGVIYQKDESFEHYLRRVIRRILDWHQKKKTS
jgi:hypothetical protein